MEWWTRMCYSAVLFLPIEMNGAVLRIRGSTVIKQRRGKGDWGPPLLVIGGGSHHDHTFITYPFPIFHRHDMPSLYD